MGDSYRAAVLYAEFSDRHAEQHLDEPLNFDEMRSLAQACASGQLIESSRRKLVALFPHAQDGLDAGRAALGLVEKLRRAEVQRRGLAVRAVLGYGDVSVESGRLHSAWSFRLPRLASQLPDNGLGATDDFVAQYGAANLQPPPRASAVEGLFVLGGGEANETRMASAFAAVEAGIFAELQLRLRGVTRAYKPVDCPLLIGRDATCALKLSGDTASRIHGRIEYENSKFRYVDQSRNGSYVLTGTGEEIFLNSGEHIVLAGEGAISPGAPVSQQRGEVLRYECRTTRLSLDAPSFSDTQAINSPKKT